MKVEKGMVLGGGLSGLISGYLLGFDVYTKNVGGQLSEFEKLGPRILEFTPYTQRFMEKLYGKNSDEIKKKKEFEIAYLKNGNLYKSLTVEMKSEYCEKTRGKNLNLFPKILSGGENKKIGWDINEIKLIEKLKENVNIEKLNINLINSKFLTVNDEFKAKRLISTIPLNVLSTIIDEPIDKKFEAKDINFYICDFDVELFKESYIYVIDQDIKFHRITKDSPKKYIIESEYELRKDDLRIFGVKPSIMVKYTIRKSQILNNLNIQKINNIELVGRYAQWNHSIKMDEIIKRLQ